LLNFVNTDFLDIPIYINLITKSLKRGNFIILKTARSWTFLLYKEKGSKPLPVPGRGLDRGFIFG